MENYSNPLSSKMVPVGYLQQLGHGHSIHHGHPHSQMTIGSMPTTGVVMPGGMHHPQTMMYGLPLSRLIMENGFRSTGRDILPNLLSSFNMLKESDVAHTLGMMASTHNSMEMVSLSQRTKHLQLSNGMNIQDRSTVSPMLNQNYLDTWNYIEFVDITMEMFPYLNWTLVIQSLDYPEFYINDLKGVEMIVRSFYHATKNSQEFPLYLFYKPWENLSGQLSFIRNALLASPDLLNFSKDSRRIIGNEDIESNVTGATKTVIYHLMNQSWNSLHLIEFICSVVDTEYFDEVRPIFELASKQSPELLCLALAFINPPWNSILREILVKLTTGFLAGQPSSPIVLPRLWRINPQVMLNCMVEMQRRDPTCISRLLDISQELKILSKVLDTKPFSFSIEMASLASRREHLNLEKWLQDSIRDKKDPFVRACLDFISEKCFHQSQKTVLPLPTENLIIFIKVLNAAHNTMSYESAGIFRTMQYAFSSDPQFASVWSPSVMNTSATAVKLNISMEDYNTPEFIHYIEMNFASDIEAEANSFYEKIYAQEASVNDILETMARLKNSENLRDGKIFACMVHNLLDEFRFFPKYPEKELTLTGVIYGLLIQRSLITYPPLGISLRFILDSLKLPVDSKMFKFGLTALIQFQSRLSDWPPYCIHLLEIPIMSSFHELMIQIKHSLAISPIHRDLCNSTLHPIIQYLPSLENTTITMSLSQAGFPCLKNKAFKDELDSFYSTQNISKPDEQFQDKISFILNNISSRNLSSKLKDISIILLNEERYFKWFSDYLVTKRILIEPNYHSIYFSVLDQLKFSLLTKYVLLETYFHIRELLESEKTVSSSAERSLLKNLGSWLGGLTLSKNIPILHKHLPIKDLLIEGYEIDKLIVVIPFVCKVLEGCVNSRIFKNSNPWVINVLSLLMELYQYANLKLNLKFEIEVLCKTLKLEVTEIPITNVLKERTLKYRPLSSSHVSAEHQLYSYTRSGISSSTNAVHLISALTGPSASSSHNVTSPGASVPFNAPTVNVPTPSSANGLEALVPSIPGLTNFILFNIQAVPLFTTHSIFKKVVVLALEFSIREIAQMVIDRSVSIACLTTRELILKDFYTENNEEVMKKAAQQMMQNLTGNLILGTSKEPMRNALLNNLASFSQLAGLECIVNEGTFNLVIDDNLELACAYIEKAAIEKAIPEINSNLADEYSKRRQARLEGKSFVDEDMKALMSSENIPILRLSCEGLNSDQLKLYDDFVRISRLQNLANLQIVSIPPLSTSDYDRVANALKPIGTSSLPFRYKQDVPDGHETAPSPLTTSACMEQFLVYLISIDKIVSQHSNAGFSSFPSNHELRALMKQILILALNSTNRDEVCILFSQKIIHILYKTDSILGIEVHVVLLDKLCELSIRVTREVTAWVIYASDERKYNVPVTVAFFLSGLINILEYDIQLGKHLLEGKKENTIDFAVSLIRRCVLVEPVVTAPFDFIESVEALNTISKSNQNIPTVLKESIDKLLEEVNSKMKYIQDNNSAKSGSDNDEIKEQITYYFHEWIRLCQILSAADKSYSSFVHQVFRQGFFRSFTLTEKFFRLSLQMALSKYIARVNNEDSNSGSENMNALECYAKWISFIIRCYPSKASVNTSQKDKSTENGKIVLLNIFLSVLGKALVNSLKCDRQLAYQPAVTRLISCFLNEWNAHERNFDNLLFDILASLCQFLHTIRPTLLPEFSFGWLEIVSHRFLLPKLLATDGPGWKVYHILLVDCLRFLRPSLQGSMNESIRLYYKGTLRLFLILLHDFPEFLAAYYWTLTNEIPLNCVQLRNLILSAFPKQLKLLDPFTPNLKVDLLPESSQDPLHYSQPEAILIEKSPALKKATDDYLVDFGSLVSTVKSMDQLKYTSTYLKSLKTYFVINDSDSLFIKYDALLMSAFVLYVGMKAIDHYRQMKEKMNNSSATDFHHPFAQIFLQLCTDCHEEGRYYLLSTIANHLRYPNSHTHYFSSILLYLFSEITTIASTSASEVVREQITRVLLERLIVNRPHPWGLLITFIELIKNSKYMFWTHAFTRTCPEIERLFDSVARSCMLPKVNPAASSSVTAVE